MLKSGRTIRIDDVAADADMAEGELARRYQGLGIGAALVVPLIGGAHYGAMLFAHEDHPRRCPTARSGCCATRAT
jgi:GAF domain-containing protein